MGANMLGYLLVGPRSIEDKKEEAIAFVEQELKVAKEIEFYLMEGKTLTQDQITHMSSLGIDTDYLENIQSEYTDPITSIDSAEKFVTELVEFWELPDSRDSADRYYGDKKIVFAGEATWGDTPDGYGYTLLNQASKLGVLEILGIE